MSDVDSAAWLGQAKAKAPKITELDSSIWLGKAQAAKLMKVHPRQIERRAKQGFIEKHYLPRKAGERAARVVYSRADIERILADGIPETPLDASELALVAKAKRDALTSVLPPNAMSKEEVCEYLERSPGWVIRNAARLPGGYVNGPHGRLCYYERAAVEALKREMETPIPRAPEPSVQALATIFSDTLATSMQPQIEALRGVLLSIAPVAPPRPWLTLNEATKYSGLTKAYLRRAAKAGAAFALNIGAPGKCDNWRFNREALGKGLAIQVGKGTRA